MGQTRLRRVLAFWLMMIAGWWSAQGDDLTDEQRVALEFVKRELPRLHSELQVVLKEMPETRDPVLEVILEIEDIYNRYEEMSPELAAIFISIKRREFENQVYAETLHQTVDPEKRKRIFQQLVAHMDVTFDLNLKLVRGELAWLEEEVRQIRKVAETEQTNKKRYIKEDLESLLLENQPLLDVTISGLGRQQSAKHRAAVKRLIQMLPPNGVASEITIEDGGKGIDEKH